MTNTRHLVLTATALGDALPSCPLCSAGAGQMCDASCATQQDDGELYAEWTAPRRGWVAVARRVLVGLAMLVVAVLSVRHYGGGKTLNQGYTVGTDATYIGVETVGSPGVYGALSTPWGEVNWVDGSLSFCAAGDTDIECGA